MKKTEKFFNSKIHNILCEADMRVFMEILYSFYFSIFFNFPIVTLIESSILWIFSKCTINGQIHGYNCGFPTCGALGSFTAQGP